MLYAADHDDLLPPEGKSAPLETDLANPGYEAGISSSRNK